MPRNLSLFRSAVESRLWEDEKTGVADEAQESRCQSQHKFGTCYLQLFHDVYGLPWFSPKMLDQPPIFPIKSTFVHHFSSLRIKIIKHFFIIFLH